VFDLIRRIRAEGPTVLIVEQNVQQVLDALALPLPLPPLIVGVLTIRHSALVLLPLLARMVVLPSSTLGRNARLTNPQPTPTPAKG